MLATTFTNLQRGFDLLSSFFLQSAYPRRNEGQTAVTNSPGKFFIYDVINEDGTHRYYVSPLPHEYAFANGVPPEAVMGELTNGPNDFDPESFQQNPSFLEFLAGVICKHSGNITGPVTESQCQQDGYVYLFVKRSPTPDGRAPAEEIIGGVELERGLMRRFHASPNYRLLTKDGFIHLDDGLHQRLLAELEALSHAANEGGEIARNQSSQSELQSATQLTYA